MIGVVKDFGWDSTPLGAKSRWPSSLSALTDLMIASPQPMFIAWGLERIFLYNDGYTPILGSKHPSAFGQPFIRVWPEVMDEIGPLVDRVFGGEAVQMDDIKLTLDRGAGPTEAHFSFSYTPIRDEGGLIMGLFCICNEITSQVLMQQQIENERLRQQRMLTQMPGFVAILSGPDHTIEYVNSAFTALTSARPCLGLGARNVFPEGEGQGFFPVLDEVYAKGTSFNARAAPIQFSGDLEGRFIDLNIEAIRDEANRVIGVFVGGYDVTPAERGVEALRKSEGLLAAVVASSDDAIISKTVEGVVTSWNAGAERIFGYAADEIIGRPISVLALPDRQDEMPKILNSIRRGERVDHFETARRRKDGATVYISLSVSPIHDQKGEVVGASKVARDITAARRAEEALALAEDRLLEQRRELLHAARLGELGQMAATLAHEINQPLSAIVNYLQAGKQLMIANDPANQPMVGEAIQRANEQAVRAAEVVRRLRAFAKPNEGLPAAVSINQIVQETIDLAAIDAGRRDVCIKLVLTPDQDVVLANRIEVQQVLLNLVRNALEAMEGLSHRSLTLSTTTASDVIEVAVADTGPGLDPLVRARLFQPFVTTKEFGMGIGLSICLKIIEAHGGRLWADEGAEGGAVFRFTLRIDPSGGKAASLLSGSDQ